MGAADWKASLGALLDGMEPVPAEEPAEASTQAKPAKKPMLTIELDKKRAGKIATIIYGFADDADAADTAKQLKQKLAVGGSCRGGEILLQGDCRQKAAALLKAMGYKLPK